MTDRTLRISARMAEEIQQWTSDELSQWPRDTAYAADLESLLAQLTAEQPAPDAVTEAWTPQTNILPWVALTIDQMRAFEASDGELQRLGLNGEWMPTDTPLSPGLVYRIKPALASQKETQG